MTSWPLVRAMVPLSPGWKSTVPPEGVSRRAWRSEPGPLSSRFITVLGTQRASSASSRGRHRGGRRRLVLGRRDRRGNSMGSPFAKVSGERTRSNDLIRPRRGGQPKRVRLSFPGLLHLPAEPTQQLDQVAEADAAGAVIVEVGQVASVALGLAERRGEAQHVLHVEDAVAVAVAEQPEETGHIVGSERLPGGIMNMIGQHGQR